MRRLVLAPIQIVALLFIPAGTFDYWEGWVFAAVFFVSTLVLSLWLARTDPALLERRMKAGPRAEKETSQKIIVSLAFLAFFGSAVTSGFDRRFGWSDIPTSVVVAGDALVVLSIVGFYLVLRENTYSAATIQVTEGQRVIASGPYARVRHPMYTAGMLLMIGMPLALASWGGLLFSVLGVGALLWRIRDEERFLVTNLRGYAEYRNRVRYRMIPYIW